MSSLRVSRISVHVVPPVRPLRRSPRPGRPFGEGIESKIVQSMPGGAGDRIEIRERTAPVHYEFRYLVHLIRDGRIVRTHEADVIGAARLFSQIMIDASKLEATPPAPIRGGAPIDDNAWWSMVTDSRTLHHEPDMLPGGGYGSLAEWLDSAAPDPTPCLSDDANGFLA